MCLITFLINVYDTRSASAIGAGTFMRSSVELAALPALSRLTDISRRSLMAAAFPLFIKYVPLRILVLNRV